MIDSLRVVGLLMGPNPPTILELRSSLVPQQPNRILIHKQIRIRLVIPEEVSYWIRITWLYPTWVFGVRGLELVF